MRSPCPQVPSDADLVRAALAGQKPPLAELLRRHGDTAVALAARVLGSPDLAREAVQEAAVAVMTDLGRLRPPERFGAWFCGITLNVARRWRRNSASRSAWPAPAVPAATAQIAAEARERLGGASPGDRAAG